MPPSTFPYPLDAMQPGDVACVRTSGKLIAPLIRAGAWLQGLPHTVNHVVIAHHRDDSGALIGVEANPSGVGWVDMAGYADRWLLDNAGQPKADWQRETVCAAAGHLIGGRYDWGAIAFDALRAVGLRPTGPWWTGYTHHPPLGVTCSSMASWLYRVADIPEPSIVDRWTTPGHWAAWIETRGWDRAAHRLPG